MCQSCSCCAYPFGNLNGPRIPYLEVLVRRLLELLVHGAGASATHGTHGSEDGERGGKADNGVEDNLLVLVGGGLGTGTVGTESDPVG